MKSSGPCQPGRCAACALYLRATDGSSAVHCAADSIGVRVVARNTFLRISDDIDTRQVDFGGEKPKLMT